MQQLSEILEMIMVILFGISWPINIIKSFKAKTAKGKSGLFLGFIILGYISGIISKIVINKISYVLIFYFINLLMVTIDLILFFKNHKLDLMRERI